MAHLGKSLFWYSSEILFAFFLTELAGLAAQDMGLVIASGFLASAVIDLVLGHSLSRWLTSARSAGRLQFFGAVACSFGLTAVFLGALIPTDWRFAYAIGAGILFRFTFAIYDIPQNALMALGTGDSVSRLSLASTRIWFSGIATMLVATTVGPLVALRSTDSGLEYLFALTAAFSVFSVSSSALLARAMGGSVRTRSSEIPKGTDKTLVGTFWVLLLVMVASSTFTPAFGKLEPYYASFVLKSAWWGGVMMVAMAGGVVIGQPLWPCLCRQLSGGIVMMLNAALQILALGLLWSTDPSAPFLAAIAAFLFGVGNGGIGMVQWAAFSETVAQLAPSRTGLAYGLFAASSKLALAGGGIIIAEGLAGKDFRGAESAVVLDLMAVLPGIGALICLLAGFAMFALSRVEGREVTRSR